MCPLSLSLSSLGYPFPLCVRALAECSQRLPDAIAWLLDHGARLTAANSVEEEVTLLLSGGVASSSSNASGALFDDKRFNVKSLLPTASGSSGNAMFRMLENTSEPLDSVLVDSSSSSSSVTAASSSSAAAAHASAAASSDVVSKRLVDFPLVRRLASGAHVSSALLGNERALTVLHARQAVAALFEQWPVDDASSASVASSSSSASSLPSSVTQGRPFPVDKLGAFEFMSRYLRLLNYNSGRSGLSTLERSLKRLLRSEGSRVAAASSSSSSTELSLRDQAPVAHALLHETLSQLLNTVSQSPSSSPAASASERKLDSEFAAVDMETRAPMDLTLALLNLLMEQYQVWFPT